jgi:hypothetical protein
MGYITKALPMLFNFFFKEMKFPPHPLSSELETMQPGVGRFLS